MTLRSAWLAAAFALGASSATGQTVASLEACVAGSGAGDAAAIASACSQAAYEACSGQFAQPTTIDYAGCADAGYRAWDGLLNALWPEVRARAEAAGDWDRVLAAQRAWIASKEAQCPPPDPDTSGTIGPLEQVWCLRDMTATRTVEFWSQLRR